MTPIKAELLKLNAAEKRAWRAMMGAAPELACSIYGQEGANYLAWRDAADAERAFREANDLLGVPLKRVA